MANSPNEATEKNAAQTAPPPAGAELEVTAKDVLGKVDTATNDVGNRVKYLLGHIYPGMSENQANFIRQELSAEANRLLAMGKDPSQPIPVGFPDPNTALPVPDKEPAPEKEEKPAKDEKAKKKSAQWFPVRF